MPFGNYAELQASVKRWLKRKDLDADIRDFIALAEARMSHDVSDLPPMQRSATVATAPSIRTIALPADWMWPRYVKTEGGCDVDVVVPQAIDGSQRLGGAPRRIAFAGDVALLDPVPDVAYSLLLAYVARVPALSDAAPTNWLLAQAPQMYLYAALLEAMPFLEHDARAATWASAYRVALDGLREQRWSGSPRLQVDAALGQREHFDIRSGV